MSSQDLIRDEIRQLEREIEELEESEELESKDDDDDDDIICIEDDSSNEINDERNNEQILSQIGQMDQLLYDILNEKEGEDESNIIDGKRVIYSKELKKFHESQIPKIQIENIFRFNGITIFPISNDKNGEFLGLRFDVFNSYLKKFSTCNYIILKQFQIETNGKTNTSKNKNEWKWSLFQTTIPKYIPVFDLANTYLEISHYRDNTTSDILSNQIPGFNRINKFSMHIYEHLFQLERRRTIIYQLKDQYTNKQLHQVQIKSDLAVSKIDIAISKLGKLTLLIDDATHVITDHRSGEEIQLPDLDNVFAVLKSKIDSMIIS